MKRNAIIMIALLSAAAIAACQATRSANMKQAREAVTRKVPDPSLSTSTAARTMVVTSDAQEQGLPGRIVERGRTATGNRYAVYESAPLPDGRTGLLKVVFVDSVTKAKAVRKGHRDAE